MRSESIQAPTMMAKTPPVTDHQQRLRKRRYESVKVDEFHHSRFGAALIEDKSRHLSTIVHRSKIS
jgi:hypothetical protein